MESADRGTLSNTNSLIVLILLIALGFFALLVSTLTITAVDPTKTITTGVQVGTYTPSNLTSKDSILDVTSPNSIAGTISTGAMIVYGDDTVGVPKFKEWNGTAWNSTEGSALSTGSSSINWVVLKSSRVRDEKVLAVGNSSGGISVQVWNGTYRSWGNFTVLNLSMPNAAYRGFDVAYENQSGDAIVVY